MSNLWMPAALAAAAAACLSFAAHAQATASRIVPESPLQFERVHLRVLVDDCTFDKSSVAVELQGRSLRVHHRRLPCVAPGAPESVDIQLGALPAGDYRAELVDDGSGDTLEIVDFRVERITRTLQYPPAPFPLADYSGLWGADEDPGWGLALQQGARGRLFGELLLFGSDNQPQWFTLQSGRWVTATRWSGQLVRSTGSAWAAIVEPPMPAAYAVVGAASIDFHKVPGLQHIAILTYMIDGQVVSRVVTPSRL